MNQNNTTNIECSNCGQRLRIPYDRGDLRITCPSCNTTGIWKEGSRSNSNELLKKIIAAKVTGIRDYTPKVGIFGVTGVGKSSLCNALFGKDVAAVSDVAACTRAPKEILIGNGGTGIKLVDVPGVGENIDRDKEYFELYRKLAPELDLIIWVIKADDRAYASAERAYKDILQPNLDICPVLFVINQVDKLNPLRDWNTLRNVPGIEKQKNINKKIHDVSKMFNVSTKYIHAVSVSEKYNLVSLVDTITDVLPDEKKYSFVREAKEDVKSKEVEQKAEDGILKYIKKFLGDAWDILKYEAVEIIVSKLPWPLRKLAKKYLESRM